MSTHAVAPAKSPVKVLARAPMLQRKCDCGGSAGQEAECEDCKKKKLQRRAVGDGPGVAPPIVHQVLQSPGQPLGAQTRSYFEPRFRHDFSKVRVHADEKAARSARDVNALAYTVGSDLVFGAGKYSPETKAGQALIAHELAHTIQQQGFSVASGPLAISHAGDALEIEADRAAEASLQGRRFSLTNDASQRLARQPSTPGKADDDEKKRLEELRRGILDIQKGPRAPSETEEEQEERKKKEELLNRAKSIEFGRGTPGAQATWGWGAPETNNVYQKCNVVGMERAEFLSFFKALPRPPAVPKRRTPGAPTVALGATQLRGTVVEPKIAAMAVPGGFKLKPTHAEMPAVYSAFTKDNASGFDEDTRQCNNPDCVSLRRGRTSKDPLHWIITPGGAQKIEQGEREHCEDYRTAFELTLALYASVINNLAAAERVYRTEKQATDEATRQVGVQPPDMVDRFLDMGEKTRMRDDIGWHSANDNLPKGDKHSQTCSLENGCRSLEIIDEKSLPDVGSGHSFEELASMKPLPKTKGKP